MTLKRILLVVLLCLLAFIGLPSGLPKPARACSPSGIPGLAENFKDSDIVIKSRVLEVDAFGQNAMVQVEQYYKGTGPEHVLISLNNPETVSDLLYEQPYSSCTSWYPPLSEGDRVFFLATRNFDGSYDSGGNFGQYRFDYQSANQTLDVLETSNSEDFRKYTASQLATRLTELGGKATIPNSDFLPILRAPLRLTTKNGTHYLLPVDGGKPESIPAYFDELSKYDNGYFSNLERARYDGIGKDRCVGLKCMAYSANGTAEYNFELCQESHSHDAAVFSAIGTYAIWVGGQVFVGCKDTLIAKLNTNADKFAEKLALYAQWSPDGRKLAYNDLKGLWVWETGKKENNPRLIIPADKTPVYARYFSPLGSYLAVNEGEKKYTVNLDTGATFYDGIFSPTEEFFIAFGTLDKTTGLFPVILCHNGTFRIREFMCLTSDFGNPNADISTDPDKPGGCCYVIPNVKQIEWVSDYRFYVLRVPIVDNREAEESLTPIPPWDVKKEGYMLTDAIAKNDFSLLYGFKYQGFLGRPYQTGLAFVYDRPNRSLALLKNETTVMINDRDLTFTIGKDIDSPIVQIDWLPSLMYRDNSR